MCVKHPLVPSVSDLSWCVIEISMERESVLTVSTHYDSSWCDTLGFLVFFFEVGNFSSVVAMWILVIESRLRDKGS